MRTNTYTNKPSRTVAHSYNALSQKLVKQSEKIYSITNLNTLHCWVLSNAKKKKKKKKKKKNNNNKYIYI